MVFGNSRGTVPAGGGGPWGGGSCTESSTKESGTAEALECVCRGVWGEVGVSGTSVDRKRATIAVSNGGRPQEVARPSNHPRVPQRKMCAPSGAEHASHHPQGPRWSLGGGWHPQGSRTVALCGRLVGNHGPAKQPQERPGSEALRPRHAPR